MCVLTAQHNRFSEAYPEQTDTWLARCTSTGDLEWKTSFGDPTFDDYANSMICLRDGTYLIGAIGSSVLLSCVDKDGNVLWMQSLLERQIVYGGMALIELEGRGFFVAGLIQITNGRSYDAFLLRTDAEGRVGELAICAMQYGDVAPFLPIAS